MKKLVTKFYYQIYLSIIRYWHYLHNEHKYITEKLLIKFLFGKHFQSWDSSNNIFLLLISIFYDTPCRERDPICTRMRIYTRNMYTRTCIYEGKSKNTMVFSQASSKKTRANDWSTTPLARPHAYALRDVKGLLYSRRHASLRKREGLESHSVPLFSSLCLPRDRSLKWLPSRQSLIGRDIPSFCVLQLSLFFLFTSNALIVYIHVLKKYLSFFLLRKARFWIALTNSQKKLQTLPFLGSAFSR